MSAVSKIGAGIKTFFYQELIIRKLNSGFGYLLLSLMGLALTVVVVAIDFPANLLFVVLFFGGGIAFISFVNARAGFLLTFAYSFFIFYVKRFFMHVELPIGIVVEILLVVVLFGILIRKILYRRKDLSALMAAPTFFYLLILLNMVVQLFNPLMDNPGGWGFFMFKLCGFYVMYLLSVLVFDSLRAMKAYMKIWLVLAFVAALYGCKQEWLGFFPFEDAWIRADSLRFGLIYVDFHFRKFSFLSDPTAYGILMAISGIFCFILVTGPFSSRKRLALFLAGCFMFLGMGYSGTRTAYAMVPAGLMIFALLTITNRNTLIFITVSMVLMLVILFGPIYGNPTVNRIRTLMEFSDDESLAVRDINRASIQPFLQSHPLGGGAATSGIAGLKYNPNHFLAGFPPDSAYLRTALEFGWVGLGIEMLFYFVVMRLGIRNYYRARNPAIKTYYAALLSVIFSLLVALYAQQSPTGQFPLSLIFYPSIGLLVNLIKFDESLNLNKI